MGLRAAAIGLALALAALSGAALGQTAAVNAGPDAVPYPASATSEDQVQAWVDRYLPTQGYVVGAWSSHVVMLVAIGGLDDSRYPLVTTKVLSEVLTPDAAKAAGWRAAEQIETFACDRDVYQVLSSLYYTRGDRHDRPELDAGEDAWTVPDPGATMDTVERAACFYGQRQHLAALTPFTPPLAARPPMSKPAAKAAAKRRGENQAGRRSKTVKTKHRRAVR